MSVIGSIPGPLKGDVDLHEPASVGTLGPVSVDIPDGPVNVELPMIEFNGNSSYYDDKIIIIIITFIIIIGGMIYIAVQTQLSLHQPT